MSSSTWAKSGETSRPEVSIGWGGMVCRFSTVHWPCSSEARKFMSSRAASRASVLADMNGPEPRPPVKMPCPSGPGKGM
jgi:hypothetical protein